MASNVPGVDVVNENAERYYLIQLTSILSNLDSCCKANLLGNDDLHQDRRLRCVQTLLKCIFDTIKIFFIILNIKIRF